MIIWYHYCCQLHLPNQISCQCSLHLHVMCEIGEIKQKFELDGILLLYTVSFFPHCRHGILPIHLFPHSQNKMYLSNLIIYSTWIVKVICSSKDQGHCFVKYSFLTFQYHWHCESKNAGCKIATGTYEWNGLIRLMIITLTKVTPTPFAPVGSYHSSSWFYMPASN